MLVNVTMLLILVDRLSFLAAFYVAIERGMSSDIAPFVGLLLANLLNWAVYKLLDPPLVQLCIISFFTVLLNITWIGLVVTGGLS